MKKIMLVCSAGMSTSLLVTKMEKAATAKGIEAEIFAVAESEASKHFNDIEIILLGPQVRYLLSRIEGLVKDKGIPVKVIDSIDYGMMNGEKVLNTALELIG